MADLNKTDVESKTFSLELDTGQTKKVPITNRRGRTTGERSEPITIKVPKLSTISSYDVAEDGTVSNVNSIVRQVITKAEYDALPNDVRTTQEKTIPAGGTTISRTEYYAILATRNGETGKYAYTDAVDKVFVSARDANLFKRDIAKENKGEASSISTVSAATQQAINQVEGLKPGSPKNRTGLSPNGLTAVDTPPERLDFNNFSGIGGNLDTNYSYEDKDKKIIADLRYPIDLNDKQDRIKFSMYEYGAKNLSNATNYDNKAVVTGFGERDYKPITGTVTLPIQGKITDSNVVNWGEGTIDPLQTYGAKELMSLNVNDIAKSYDKVLGNIRTLFKNQGAMGDLGTFLRTYFVEQAVQSKGLLSRTTGAILNPNVELLFQSPQLRSFNFSFFLSARSEEEAERVKRIIRYFKQGMSVKSTATDIFLKAPNIFRIEYVYGGNGNTHPGLNRIKECALKTCNVDYVPENSYMTFEDGTMTAYLVSLQFQELEPILEDDYRGDQEGKKSVIQKNEIGY